MTTITNSSSSMDLPEHNVVALLIEETTNQTESQQIKSKENYCYFFGERGKSEYPGKNLSEQSREQTNTTRV